MELSPHDIIGNVGVAMIVGSYLALQLQRIEATGVLYSVLNATGAALILVSLSVDFNLAAAVIEGFWLLISLMGIVLAYRRRA